MTTGLLIRDARPDDRAAMERICAHTWPDGDYIPYVWDRWLTDGEGPLIVGEWEGQVVALSKITFQAAGQAWLQGMRVDPDHRRQGIGRAFLDYSLDYARGHGARVARLSTSIRNTPVHTMTAQAGMERIATYVFWQAEALAEGPLPAVLSPGDREAVEAFLAASPALRACRGVYARDWGWRELSPEQVAGRLAEGGIVARLAPDGRILALAILGQDAEDSAWDAGFVDGEEPALTELALAVRTYAAGAGAARARAWLPEVDYVRRAFQAAGYAFGEWQGELLLLERRFDSLSPEGRG